MPSAYSDEPARVQTCTVVLPCYNEAESLPMLIERLESVLSAVPNLEYEFLAVDDGSTDDTPAVLERLRQQNPRVSAIRFARNFGHQAALLAGFDHAGGDAVIVMDTDLQHPPELLPKFIELWRSGFDVVQGIRESQPGLRKSMASRSFYFALNRMSNVEVQDGAADFRLMSRRAVDTLLSLPEQSRFIRGIIAWLGLPCATVPFHAAPRRAGKSQYNAWKQARLAADAVITLSNKPLGFALYLAAFTLLFMFAYFLYVVVQYVTGQPLVRGWTSTMTVILFLGCANLFCTGVLGLYLREVLAGVRRRPAYIIDRFLAREPKRAAAAANGGRK